MFWFSKKTIRLSSDLVRKLDLKAGVLLYIEPSNQKKNHSKRFILPLNQENRIGALNMKPRWTKRNTWIRANNANPSTYQEYCTPYFFQEYCTQQYCTLKPLSSALTGLLLLLLFLSFSGGAISEALFSSSVSCAAFRALLVAAFLNSSSANTNSHQNRYEDGSYTIEVKNKTIQTLKVYLITLSFFYIYEYSYFPTFKAWIVIISNVSVDFFLIF